MILVFCIQPYLYAVRYLVELKEHIELAMRVRRRYFRLFPTPSDKSRMAKFLQESEPKIGIIITVDNYISATFRLR